MKIEARGEGRGATYEIRIAGHLGAEWADWFDGMTITPEPDGHTRLTGIVADQSALYGLLRKVRDLGLTLLAVNLIVEDHGSAPEHPGTVYSTRRGGERVTETHPVPTRSTYCKEES